MRKLDLFFLLVVAALLGMMLRPEQPEARLYGSWEFRDGEETVVVTFKPDHIVDVLEDAHKIEHATYRTDFSTTPARMDLTLKDKDQVQTIFELTPEGELRIEDTQAGQPRPTRFGEKTIVLKRQTP